jgi:hypothetical protein
MHPSDIEFAHIYQHGIRHVLSVVCDFNNNEHEKIFAECECIELEIRTVQDYKPITSYQS